MSVLQHATELQQMMGQGQMMEAFEKFYHEDVKVTEMPSGEVRNGKAAQRAAIDQWQKMVTEVHGGGLESITANEESGHAAVESWIDVTFAEGGRMKMQEVAIQKWENGQIIEEKFYYNMPGK